MSKIPMICIATLLLFAIRAQAFETILTDSEGQKAYLYTETEKPIEGKEYWLAIGVHGQGGDGQQAGGIASWAKEDVIVLGPSFKNSSRDSSDQNTSQEKSANGKKGDSLSSESYQMNGLVHDAKLKALIDQVKKQWKIHPKVFLHGFSAGGQFVHRFAMKNPELVVGVSAHSAGSWSTRGFGEINLAASKIPFALSCGEYDRDKSSPTSPLGRLDWMLEFAKALKEANFDVEARKISNTGHKTTADTMTLAAECFKRARSLNFSRTCMLSCDFNEHNPMWAFKATPTQSPLGKSTTVFATCELAAGTIEKQGSSEGTGALRLQVNSASKVDSWSGILHTGLLPIRCVEKNLDKLTLAMDLKSSSVRPIEVIIESFNAKHERTGGRSGLVYPAAPGDYQRHVLDLGEMTSVGKGTFNTEDPFIQISLSIDGKNGWNKGGFHELLVDNLCYAAPALYVSPTGKDADHGGETSDDPLATVGKALSRAKAGDIIMLMDGAFVRKNTIADFPRAGMAAAWITVRNHPGHKPVLTCSDWNTIKIGKGSAQDTSNEPALAYLEIRGLTVRGIADEVETKYKDDVGKPKGTTNGNGISIDGRFNVNKPHHIRIADNTVLQCCGGGISVIHGDCVQVENNHVHNNCHWMIYAGSGISIYQPFNFNTTKGGHRILVRFNHTHDNYCTQPWVAVGKLSDGNGIIIDDTQNHQNKSPNGAYHGGLLVQGNLSHDNGGSGMHSYASDHVDFINNTVYHNCNVMDYGQLSVTACGHVRVLNNIIVAQKDKPLNRVNGAFHHVLLSHNLFWGGNGDKVTGENAVNEDPLFVNAAEKDFHLMEKSPARNAGGCWEIGPVMYLNGNLRPTDEMDLGALGSVTP